MPRIERPAMASYGVPADLDGALPWTWAEQRLVESRNYWLATVDHSDRPHVMPLWGLWRPRDETFSFSCASESLKARNLATNPYVVVAVDDTVEVVSVEGVASLATGRSDIAEEYAAKYHVPFGSAQASARYRADQGDRRCCPWEIAVRGARAHRCSRGAKQIGATGPRGYRGS